jgi:hypothetical protein
MARQRPLSMILNYLWYAMRYHSWAFAPVRTFHANRVERSRRFTAPCGGNMVPAGDQRPARQLHDRPNEVGPLWRCVPDCRHRFTDLGESSANLSRATSSWIRDSPAVDGLRRVFIAAPHCCTGRDVLPSAYSTASSCWNLPSCDPTAQPLRCRVREGSSDHDEHEAHSPARDSGLW